MVLQLGSFSRPDVLIFSAAGTPLGRVLWDGGRILAAGWTVVEDLLVVDDRGRVQRFTPHGQPSAGSPPFSLGSAVEHEGLADVIISDQSIVARTATGHMWCVPDVGEPRPQRYPDPTPVGAGAVHCMCPVPALLSTSGALEVLVAVDTTIVLVDSDEVTPSSVYEGPIVKLALSPDGRMVAGFAADDVIYIWTYDLDETIVRISVGDTAEDMADALPGVDAGGVPSGPPDGFVWCGCDGVIGQWNGVGALLISIEGGWQWWDLGPGPAALVGEVDGARAVTTDQHLFIRKVPPPLASVLEIGSTSPGALLHDARKLYDERDARAAAELLDVLRCGDLPSAAAACLGAAAAELNPARQESLMRAGCYGRAFLALDSATQEDSLSLTAQGLPTAPAGKEVVMLARTLRVLNALRDHQIALPLTMPQFESLGMKRLIARLTGRRHYLLALRVCSALGAPPEDVLFRWACDKIAASASSAPDEELLGVLRGKLEGQLGVKWAAVAAHAQAQGRPRLAAALAEHESCAADQVPLMLALGEEEAALRRAVDSGDPDLTFEVVHSMWRHLERHHSAEAQRRFWTSVAAHSSAAALLAKFLSGSGDPEAVLAMWESIHDAGAGAVAHVDAALNPSTPAMQKTREWNRAKEAYTRDERVGKEDARFESAAAGAALRLLEVQGELEKTTGRDGFIGLNVVDTLKQCLRLGLKDPAQKIAKEFKVPEKQQILLSVGATAASQDWAALQQMASKLDRRAPITMEHFVSAARSNGAPVPAVRWFVDRLTGDNALVRRAQLYAELGLQREAAMLAEQAEMAGAGAGVLGSLREAVGGTMGSLMGRMNG